MPIYEYACGACGHTFEEWQKMSDAPVKTCPKCKKKKVEKLISQTAFQLKGGGWYKDLYSSSKPGAKDGGGAGKEAGGGSSDGGGKDSDSSNKSEAKADAKSGSKESGAKESGSKKDSKGDVKDAKKKDSPKKSETRAA